MSLVAHHAASGSKLIEPSRRTRHATRGSSSQQPSSKTPPARGTTWMSTLVVIGGAGGLIIPRSGVRVAPPPPFVLNDFRRFCHLAGQLACYKPWYKSVRSASRQLEIIGVLAVRAQVG